MNGSPEQYEPIDWSRLWHLQLPPKVRVFVWRWGSNILPTGGNLAKRIPEVSDECPFCGLVETQEHITRDCDWAGRIWRPSYLNKLFSMGEDQNCVSWICELLDQAKDEEICEFLITVWFIWKERNNHQFNNRKLEEWEVVERAQLYLEEYRRAQDRDLQPARSNRRYKWEKPTMGYKANVDASVLKNGGTGVGMVVRDKERKFVMAVVRRTRVTWQPEIAEA
ncbi:unnamed protein product [Linum trigynum]|uniref:Reverse transcriptase zinc-binding domain-containing protein n=1 Tax=Linum trigynum TaxID=586398 RepID=A0AAV2FQM4_9ROSI